MKTCAHVTIATLLAVGTGVFCVDFAGAAEQRKGPLKDMPSEPQGEHLEKIKALGDNEWVRLGAPAPDPEWGVARGRSWGGKAFVLAPDIRGAFFGGEGNHAYVKPDGYGMNDYWVYDINAHRWICIHPGVYTRNFSQQVKDGDLRVNEKGQVVNREGRVMPGHLVHAWGFFAYDTDRNRFATAVGHAYNAYFFPGTLYNAPNRKDVLEGLRNLQKEIKAREPKLKSPLYYDTAMGEFEWYPASGNQPRMGFPQFFYIPPRKQFFLFGQDKGAYFDPEQNVWTPVKVKGKRLYGYDINACYDTKRNVIYSGKFGPGSRDELEKAGNRHVLLVYDIETDTWSQPDAKGECPTRWSTNRCSIHYDSVNDVVVFFDYAYSKEKVRVYDPETSTWLDPLPMPDGIQRRWDHGHAFYDPELNVHFVFLAGDSRDNGIMWAYRYKRGEWNEGEGM